jgi:hypothetical protein
MTTGRGTSSGERAGSRASSTAQEGLSATWLRPGVVPPRYRSPVRLGASPTSSWRPTKVRSRPRQRHGRLGQLGGCALPRCGRHLGPELQPLGAGRPQRRRTPAPPLTMDDGSLRTDVGRPPFGKSIHRCPEQSLKRAPAALEAAPSARFTKVRQSRGSQPPLATRLLPAECGHQLRPNASASSWCNRPSEGPSRTAFSFTPPPGGGIGRGP